MRFVQYGLVVFCTVLCHGCLLFPHLGCLVGVTTILTVGAFGNRLREIRTKKRISQEDLALKAGVDRSYMGRLERGELNPTLTKICQLSEALEIDVVDFFSTKK